MQPNFNQIHYLVGNEKLLNEMPQCNSSPLFSEDRIIFLNLVSKKLLSDKEARLYPDVVTFAFWCRKSSIEKQRKKFEQGANGIVRLGRGVIFHIAPSNVAVNYAYSFVTGFITGNANIVRLPSKDFQQVKLINKAVNSALEEMPELRPYICFVRYERLKEINDILSSIADIRVIWGGDQTIHEIRKSELKSRATEVTFADRYSLCVIDSDMYLQIDNKEKVAEDFYNDTYLTDQNACTSPRIILWMGKERESAKKEFWSVLYEKVKNKYIYQPIQGVNKLTSVCLLAVGQENVRRIKTKDNMLVRVKVEKLTEELMDYRDNSGYFFEYDMEHIEEMRFLCTEKMQTLSYIGKPEIFYPLIKTGIRGIDRIVPIGRTMDFDFIWDGYDLIERLSRQIKIIGE